MSAALKIENWEASKVPLQSLEPYLHLFPKATGVDRTVKRNAGVEHTVRFIPQVVKQCAWQVELYVAKELKHLPLEQACRKLWHFVRFHIRWVKDAMGYEQVKSPRRLISDGAGDCDCMTTFVDTCMNVYGVEGIVNRITAYDGNPNYSHIYSLIPDNRGGFIIVDCCYPFFNKEKHYTKKQDYNMDLQFLDGIDDNTSNQLPGLDANDLFGQDNLAGEIGRLLRRQNNKSNNSGGIVKKLPLLNRRSQEVKQTVRDNRKKAIQNAGKKTLTVINKVNKVNPATVLFRAGFLASMKLNLMKVAERIKWGYATPQQAASMGMDMSKYARLKNVLAQAEKLFFAAGGKRENLRKAIMDGKGNQNRELSGGYDFTENTMLTEMLGEIYLDEFVDGMDGMDGLESLGEPATAASITAASGALASLAALLNAVGTLFPKRSPAKPPKQKRRSSPPSGGADTTTSEPPASEAENSGGEPYSEPNAESPAESTTENNEQDTPEATTEENSETQTPEESGEDPGSESQQEQGTEGLGSLVLKLKSFYDNHQKWIKPTVFAGAGFIAGYLISQAFSGDKKTNSLNGIDGIKREEGTGEDEVIALM